MIRGCTFREIGVSLALWHDQNDLYTDQVESLFSISRAAGTDSTDDNAIRRHEARRVAKSLLEVRSLHVNLRMSKPGLEKYECHRQKSCPTYPEYMHKF